MAYKRLPMHRAALILLGILGLNYLSPSQRFLNSGIKVKVVPDEKININFDRNLRKWDGFGINYIEACETHTFSKNHTIKSQFRSDPFKAIEIKIPM